MADEFIGIAEVEVVVQHIVFALAIIVVLSDIEVLVHLLHFVGMGMGAAVASHDAISTEGIVILYIWQTP